LRLLNSWEDVPADTNILKTLVHAIAIVLAAATAFGQVDTGAILCQVTDPTGAVVPAAKVTVTSEDTGLALNSTTDEKGEYIFTPLNTAQRRRLRTTSRGRAHPTSSKPVLWRSEFSFRSRSRRNRVA
jgi:Carboxypeptidase regulatory-like domain